MGTYIDRYSGFRFNGEMTTLPGLVIPYEASDKEVINKVGRTRLDILSQKYYNNPYSGWLIMNANPQYGGLEFLIPDQSPLRIPFPFESAVQRYTTEINKYKALYGNSNKTNGTR